MLTDAQMREHMARGWRGGLQDGTVCGFGSTMQSTEAIRAWLPSVFDRYDIESINDAGAGDRHWHKPLAVACRLRNIHVTWRAFDLVPRAPDVIECDISKQRMPEADAILCRHVLNHLDIARVGAALALFKECARFIIATQFDRANTDEHREFSRLDLRRWLGEPLESSEDGGAANCRLAIWKI